MPSPGIRVCVCVLIFNAVVKLLKGSVKDWPAALIFAAVLAAALLTDLSPVIFVAGAAGAGHRADPELHEGG